MAERNAAELRAAATATGYFNGPLLQYVGDGYTVPWEVALAASLPLGVTMWAYKQHLDATDLEASRLHDWLYTPYGALIDATRKEADDALFEELNQVSPVDAAIVYAAVRAGGAPYFGTSQTGYHGILWPVVPPDPPAQPNSGDNIGVAPTRAFDGFFNLPFFPGGNMANIKCVMVLQQTTTPGSSVPSIGLGGRAHEGGWTESWMSSSSDLTTTLNFLFGSGGVGHGLLQTRATLLPNGASVIGVRLYAGGAGKGALYPAGFPGTTGTLGNVQSALLCAAPSGTQPSVRRFRIGCIPDEQVANGEFNPTYAYASALYNYFSFLSNFGWNGNTSVPVYQVFNISAAGLVTQVPNSVFAVGQIVTISGSVDSGGVRRGGKFLVSQTGPNLNQFTITGWTFGATTGGTASQPAKGFSPVGGGGATFPEVVRIVARKMGRPFEMYRGRRSRRRH